MRVCIIGSGKVATHLALRLFEKGVVIVQVFSRSIEHASTLAKLVQSKPINDYMDLAKGQDLYILAVSDNAIEPVAQKMQEVLGSQHAFVVHTSGATPGSILKEHFKRYGVFYPLQTFSKEVNPKWETIPICIDASNIADVHSLQELGKKCSNTVVRISDDQRAALHVAAVFANNFTNHMLHLSWLIAKEHGVDFSILMPLIKETIRKVGDNNPGDMQTGPALREDDNTIAAHLELLANHPDIQLVYEVLSKSILQQKH